MTKTEFFPRIEQKDKFFSRKEFLNIILGLLASIFGLEVIASFFPRLMSPDLSPHDPLTQSLIELVSLRESNISEQHMLVLHTSVEELLANLDPHKLISLTIAVTDPDGHVTFHSYQNEAGENTATVRWDVTTDSLETSTLLKKQIQINGGQSRVINFPRDTIQLSFYYPDNHEKTADQLLKILIEQQYNFPEQNIHFHYFLNLFLQTEIIDHPVTNSRIMEEILSLLGEERMIESTIDSSYTIKTVSNFIAFLESSQIISSGGFFETNFDWDGKPDYRQISLRAINFLWLTNEKKEYQLNIEQIFRGGQNNLRIILSSSDHSSPVQFLLSSNDRLAIAFLEPLLNFTLKHCQKECQSSCV